MHRQGYYDDGYAGRSSRTSIKGGATIIQLREKDCTSREFYELALSIKDITDAYEVPLIINDRLDIALAVHADGVHLGQSDIPVQVARNVMGPNCIVGATANTLEKAKEAWQSGADYLGVGDVFGSATKNDTKPVELKELKKICDTVKIPVVAIGGISKKNIHLLKDTGVAGVAVISAVLGQTDITAAAEELISGSPEA